MTKFHLQNPHCRRLHVVLWLLYVFCSTHAPMHTQQVNVIKAGTGRWRQDVKLGHIGKCKTPMEGVIRSQIWRNQLVLIWIMLIIDEVTIQSYSAKRLWRLKVHKKWDLQDWVDKSIVRYEAESRVTTVFLAGVTWGCQSHSLDANFSLIGHFLPLGCEVPVMMEQQSLSHTSEFTTCTRPAGGRSLT